MLIAIYYLRITTCQIISTLNPIVLIYFGVIFLNEKYYSRYIIGVIMGIIGSCIIVLNENKVAKQESKKNENSNDNNSSNSYVLIGLFSIWEEFLIFKFIKSVCFSFSFLIFSSILELLY